MTNPVSISSDLQPHPDVVARRVKGEAVLVHLGRNEIFSLNESGARLWELLAEGHRESEALARLIEEFEVSEVDLRREARQLLTSLECEGLVVRRPSS